MNGLIPTTKKRLLKLPKLPRIDLRGLTAARGELTHDCWTDSGLGNTLDIWIEGFSADEIAALGGFHVVRAYWYCGPGEQSYGYVIYDDREADDVLEPVMARNERGSYYDVQPPKWLCERIRRALPPIPEGWQDARTDPGAGEPGGA